MFSPPSRIGSLFGSGFSTYTTTNLFLSPQKSPNMKNKKTMFQTQNKFNFSD